MMKKPDSLAIAFLLLLTLIFSWKFIFLNYVPLPADILQQQYPWKHYNKENRSPHNPVLNDAIEAYYPWKKFTIESLKKNEFPLWNPYSLCGNTHFANFQQAVLSPFNLFFFVLPFNSAIGVSILLRIFLSTLFMYIFMREIKATPTSSVFSAIIFGFNAYFIYFLEVEWVYGVFMWTPLILFLTEKTISTKSYFFSILMGIFLAVQMLSGHLQFISYSLMVIIFYSAVRIAYEFRSNKSFHQTFGLIILIAVGIIIGSLLSAIQIIPSLEAIKYGGAREIQAFSNYDFSLLNICRTLSTLLTPNFCGRLEKYDTITAYASISSYQNCIYVGIIPLLFGVMAWWWVKHQHSTIFKTLIVFSFLFGCTPLYYILYVLVPGYNRTLDPSRLFLSIFPMCLSILAGLSLNRFVNEVREENRIKKLGLLCFITIIISALVPLLGKLLLTLFKEPIIRYGKNYVEQFVYGKFLHYDTLANYCAKVDNIYYRLFDNFNFSNFYIPIISCLSILLLLKLLLRRKVKPSLLSYCVIGLTAFDLLFFGMDFCTFEHPKYIYPKTKSIAFLEERKGLFRVLPLGKMEPGNVETVMGANALMVYHFHNARGYDSIYPKRFKEFMTAIERGPENYDEDIFTNQIFLKSYNPRLFDLLNVKYILTTRDLREERFKLIYDKDIRIYENRDVLPRAFIVHEVKVLKDEVSILRELSRFSHNFLEHVILEEEPKTFRRENRFLNDHKSEAVDILEYQPNRVSINTLLKSEGFLVLTDNFYPGWKCYVDSKETRIHRANYTFRAVHLNKGQHSVEFVYNPKTFKFGLYLTCFGILLVFIISIVRISLKRAK